MPAKPTSLNPAPVRPRTIRWSLLTDAALTGQPIAGVNSIAIPVLAQDRSLIAAILMIGNESDMDVACGADLDANVSEILASLGPEELR